MSAALHLTEQLIAQASVTPVVADIARLTNIYRRILETLETQAHA